MTRCLPPLLLVFLSCAAWAQPDARWSGVDRVVVVADVHGAYPALAGLLEATGIVDEQAAWSGGDAHLVSLGDLLDRGPESRRVMDLLMRLEREAAAAGGRVHVVLGNHELMNLTGDLRYVSAAEFAAFAADETDAMRAEAYDAWASARAEDADATRAAFDQTYPPGYFAHREAFSPGGRYGDWLLARPAIVVVNATAYAHGGLSSLVAASSLDAVNAAVSTKLERYLALRIELAGDGILPPTDMQDDAARARAALERLDAEEEGETAGTAAGTVPVPPESRPALEEFVALADRSELALDGPLWYRGSMYCKPLLEEPVLDAALAALGAERVVVGHTPTGNRRVQARYGGRVIALDTGMLASYYAGHPAALVLEAGRTDIQYLNPAERAGLDPTTTPEAYGMSEEALVAALGTGSVSAVERGDADAAPWRVTLDADGTSLRTLFYPFAEDGELEIAADVLDELLATDLVPPTVERTIDGTEGALQLVYEDAVSEAERRGRGLGIAGWCPLEPQLALMYTFDALTANRGRSAGNLYFNNDFSDLTLTGHGRAFGTERRLFAGVDPEALGMPAPLVERLRALDEDQVEAAFGDRLDRRQIRGLLARRDELVETR